MQLLVFVYRNTAAVVFYSDGVIWVDGDFNVGTIARHRLVDGVVDGLVDQVMETFLGDVSNVHRRTLAYCFQAFEDLNVARRIIICGVLILFHF